MSAVVLQNPNDESVQVRVLRKRGLFSLTRVDKALTVGPSSSGSVEVPPGRYYIRYKFSGSSGVWEGDPFQLDAGCAAQITLQRMAGGNYGVKPASGSL